MHARHTLSTSLAGMESLAEGIVVVNAEATGNKQKYERSFMRITSFRTLAIACVLTAVLAACSFAGFKPSVQGKKFIASGWHTPNAEYIKEHIQEMEELPFDGMIFGTFYPFFPNLRNQQAELEKYAETVKSTQFKKFTDNFIGVESGNDGSFDWFDEASYNNMINGWRLLARAAKQSGMKGMKFDPECYEGPSPFNYEGLKQKDTKSPEEYEKQIEKVAGMLMDAINEEYPDITLLFYFGPSVAGYPRNLAGWCGMMPGFVDGMLKKAKPGFKIVDGFEQSYGYRTKLQYKQARAKMVATAAHSAVPSAYAKHVQVGFAFWPGQMAGNPTIGRKSFDVENITENYYVPDEIAYAEHNALCYADEYVWMWSESMDVWNKRVMVYLPDGSWQFQPLPASYLEAMARAKNKTVPEPAPRKMSRPGYTAKDLGEIDDAVVFADLWSSYDDVLTLPDMWKFLPDREDRGQKLGFYRESFDDSAWPTINTREIWDQQGFVGLVPYGWYRLKLIAPADLAGKKLFLAFGAVDEGAFVYVNGKLAGVHDKDPDLSYNERFLIDVTKLLRPGAANVIAVKVKNIVGAGGIWKGIKLVIEK